MKIEEFIKKIGKKEEYRPIAHAISELTAKDKSDQTGILTPYEIQEIFIWELVEEIYSVDTKFNVQKLIKKRELLSKSKDGKGLETLASLMRENINIENDKEIAKELMSK